MSNSIEDTQFEPELLRLKGVYIEKYGPLIHQYLGIPNGLNILYGLNGAGKSQVLNCVKDALRLDQKFTQTLFRESYNLDSAVALVFSINSWGAYFQEGRRIWTATGYGDGVGIPNRNDVLWAHEFEGAARRSEYSNMWDLVSEITDDTYTMEMLNDTLNDGLILLIPRTELNLFQVVYAIDLATKSEIFHKEWQRVNQEIQKYEQLINSDGWSDSPENEATDEYRKLLAAISKSPFANPFVLMHTIIDRNLDYLESYWSHDGTHDNPQWSIPFVPISSLGYVKEAPVHLVDENLMLDMQDAARKTALQVLDEVLKEAKVQLFEMDEDEDFDYFAHRSVALLPDTELNQRMVLKTQDKGKAGNRLLKSLVWDSVSIEYELGDASGWLYGHSPRWNAQTSLQTYAEFNALSSAQQRWVLFSINTVIENSNCGYWHDSVGRLVIIDEPERGLHRSAEDYLSLGLAAYAESGVDLLVASHSPSFLDQPNAHLSQIDVGKSIPMSTNVEGVVTATIQNLSRPTLDNAHSLGLRVSDLLRITRVFWLVEGEHEVSLFETLFEVELKQAGIRILPIRGTKSLASIADSQILFDYTSAQILVTLDNLLQKTVSEAWQNARSAMEKKIPVNKILDTLRREIGSGSGEQRYLIEFLQASILNRRHDRIDINSLRKKDVIEYFSPKVFDLSDTWQMLRNEFRQQSEYKDFKEFLRNAKNARISSSRIREHAFELQGNPEIQDCFESAVQLSWLPR